MPWLTLSGSNYPCLKQIFMAPKMFEPLRFDCNLTLTHFSLETPQKLIGKQCRPRSDAAECSVCSRSTLFANSFTIFLQEYLNHAAWHTWDWHSTSVHYPYTDKEYILYSIGIRSWSKLRDNALSNKIASWLKSFCSDAKHSQFKNEKKRKKMTNIKTVHPLRWKAMTFIFDISLSCLSICTLN